MTEPDWSSFHVVGDREQAKLLTEPVSKAFFKPFLARTRTASEAAAELGCNLNTVLYRIKTMLAAGLLEVTHGTKRKGRAIKHYRSRHDAYFIPFNLTPYATLEERLGAQATPIFGALLGAYADALRQNERFGNYLLRQPGGAVLTTDFVPEATASGQPVVYSDTVVDFTQEAAQQLAAALRTLFSDSSNENKAPPNAPQQPYMLMVALLPLPR